MGDLACHPNFYRARISPNKGPVQYYHCISFSLRRNGQASRSVEGSLMLWDGWDIVGEKKAEIVVD
jgi:hypothetical protein